jgi:2-polyprenyl-3-methyl-5-hydroxy-6-metoxy-1,4-benzoquinol methylase
MAEFPDDEMARLTSVAERYDPSDPTKEFDYHLKRLHRLVMRPWLLGDRALEMGCATGELTSLLLPMCRRYEVVDGAESNVEAVRKRFDSVIAHHALFEEFAPEGVYSDIILNNALEHVVDPPAILRLAHSWLAPGGRVHITVPNADSLHRLVGVQMGMLETRTSLSESDVRIGHRRVYTIDTLRRDISTGGFDIMHWQGIFLKVLANAQMLEWSTDLILAMHEVGQNFPASCAEIYVVAEPRRS